MLAGEGSINLLPGQALRPAQLADALIGIALGDLVTAHQEKITPVVHGEEVAVVPLPQLPGGGEVPVRAHQQLLAPEAEHGILRRGDEPGLIFIVQRVGKNVLDHCLLKPFLNSLCTLLQQRLGLRSENVPEQGILRQRGMGNGPGSGVGAGGQQTAQSGKADHIFLR